MTCDDIRQNLKPFLENLLKEEEYQAFLAHLKQCPQCRDHVMAVDSFSNHVWMLGDVQVPSDFASTVMFQLQQTGRKPLRLDPAAPKKMPAAVLTLALALAMFLLGMGYFQVYKIFSEQHDTAKASKEVKGPGNIPELPRTAAAVAETPGRPDAAIADGRADSQTGPSGKIPEVGGLPDTGTLLDESAPVAAEPVLLHWHFVFSYGDGAAELYQLRKSKRDMEIRYQQGIERKARLETDAAALEKNLLESEAALMENPDGAEGAPPPAGPAEFELKQTRELIQSQETATASLEDEILRMESRIKEKIAERNPKEAEMLGMFAALGVAFDYQDENSLLFTVTKEKLAQVLERIAGFSREDFSLENFTPSVTEFTDAQYRVSVYLEREEISVLHWHVRPVLPGQKARFFNMIRQKGGTISYELGDELVFSVPASEIGNLKEQMALMRIGLSEFGYSREEAAGLTDEQIAVSVYFIK